MTATTEGGLRPSLAPHDTVEFVDEIPPKYRRPFQRSSVRWPEMQERRLLPVK
jgi:hypothetical protein